MNPIYTRIRFLVTLAMAASLAMGAAVQAQTALDTILKAKSIKIAVPTDYPPYGFVDANLIPRGLDVEMANYVAEKLGVKLEYISVTSANRVAYLQTRKADMVISTLGKTPEREKVIDFTASYAPFAQALFGSKELPVKTWADLAGKSVAVTRGVMEDQALTKIAPTGLEIRRFEDQNATVAAFVAGQTQLVASSAPTVANIVSKNPGLSVEYKLLILDTYCYMGIAKGEEKLRLQVNQIIAEAIRSGAVDAMTKKWLGRAAGDLPV